MTVDKSTKLIVGLCTMALVLVVRLFHIQIVDKSYTESADNQSMVREWIYPSRGIIYDRNGEILVGNKITYDIIVTPRELSKVEFDTLALADALGITPEYIKDKFSYYANYRRRIGWRSEIFLKHVDAEKYVKFAELQQLKFPGFKGVARSSREYPINAGGNLLGYCSEVDEAYMTRHPGEYRAGDYAGKTGIEAAMEKELRGEKGYKVKVRGSDSRVKESYDNGAIDKEAVAGKNVVTCIDAQLQSYGQQLMKNKVGALVAIEPSSGEILALISSPCIDVDCLENFSAHYNEIAGNKYRPMFNRAVASSYPPGSVFKLVNGLIGLQEGVLVPSTRYPCAGGYSYGKDKKVGCHRHWSPLNMNQAIMMSCNGYFCYVFRSIIENPKYGGVRNGLDKWKEYATSFGFGRKLGSDFPSEKGGIIPDSKRYDKIYRRWNGNTVISLSIGQGEIGCTPLHIANLAATIANRGWYYIPHIVKSSPGIDIDAKYFEKHYTMVDAENFEKVIPGMYNAVNGGPESGGTAVTGAVPGLDICGKTGTAQNPRGDDNSVFICFAPRDNPKIAVAAYIENAGFGATWAVPLATLMVEKYLLGQTTRPEMEEAMMKGSLMHKVKPYK